MKITVEKDDLLLNYLYNHLDMPKKRIKQYLSHGAIYVNNNKTVIICLENRYQINKLMIDF